METFGIVLENIVLMNHTLFGDRRTFPVTTPAEKGDVEWTYRGLWIVALDDIVTAMATDANRRELIAPPGRLAVQGFRLFLGDFRVAG